MTKANLEILADQIEKIFLSILNDVECTRDGVGVLMPLVNSCRLETKFSKKKSQQLSFIPKFASFSG